MWLTQRQVVTRRMVAVVAVAHQSSEREQQPSASSSPWLVTTAQWLWVRVQNHFSGTTMNHSRAAASNLQSRCGDDDVGLIDGEGGWCELSRVREPHRHRRSVAARVTRCRYMTRLRRRGHFRLVPDTERGGSNTTVSFTSLLFHRSHQVTFCTSVYKG